jgi:hypothetical protein
MRRDHFTLRPLRALLLIPGLLVLWTTPVLGQGRSAFHLPPHAVAVAPGIFDLGVAQDVDGRDVRGVAFLHPRRGFARKPGPGGGGSTQCYAFLASGAKWKTAEDYVLDPANDYGLTQDYLEGAIVDGLAEWESGAGPNIAIFGGLDLDPPKPVDGADETSPDGMNEILFAPIAEPGTVAVTIVWGVFSGPPFARQLVEWDMVFNTDFAWGDADQDPSVMDFLNVFTHEAGHAAGLSHPADTCTEETMYRFTQEGETKKRTLDAGDIAGIRALY